MLHMFFVRIKLASTTTPIYGDDLEKVSTVANFLSTDISMYLCSNNCSIGKSTIGEGLPETESRESGSRITNSNTQRDGKGLESAYFLF
jgi:hypothetical protein